MAFLRRASLGRQSPGGRNGKTTMSDDDIKQVFMHCENDNPEGLYAEVDVFEFARKLEAYILANLKTED